MLESIFSKVQLICPGCRNKNLRSKIEIESILQTDRDFILHGALICSNTKCHIRFPILNGIPVIIREIQRWLASLEVELPATAEECEALKDRLESGSGQLDAHSRLLSIYMDAHYGGDSEELSTLHISCNRDLFWQRALELIEGCQFQHAIDLGCSVGRYTFELAKMCSVAVGLDLNFAYLSMAAKIQRLHHFQHQVVQFDAPQNALFILADALDPPFEPFTHDLVSALNLLDAVSVPLTLLGQMDALLKNGGKLILSCPYEWRSNITKPEEWLVSPEMDSGEIVKNILKGDHFSNLDFNYEIDTEMQRVPWFLRNHSRYWSLFLVHMLRASKKSEL